MKTKTILCVLCASASLRLILYFDLSQQGFGACEHGFEHRGCQSSGLGVVAAAVVGIDQYTAFEPVFCSMADDSGRIETLIGRDRADRKKMSIITRHGRPAETHWSLRQQFEGAALLSLELKTGRTHQARVHCAAIQHAVVGDPVYGSRKQLKNIRSKLPGMPDAVVASLNSVKRQMLHAAILGFTHPATGEKMMFEAPMPQDMAQLLDKLRECIG